MFGGPSGLPADPQNVEIDPGASSRMPEGEG